MNGIIAWWARNTVAANLLMIAILLAGVMGYLRVDREVFPSVAIKSAQISVAWPGAAPQEVEEQIILRIEEAVADVDGVKEISSTAVEGSASITVQGEDNVDLDSFINEIKNRVDGISTLPQDSYPPIVREIRFNQDQIYLALLGDIPERQLTRLARDLRDELAQLPGGSPLVEVQDARKEEVSIEVSEDALRSYGLTFDDVAAAVRGGSVNLSAGSVRADTGTIQLRARNLADTQQQFGDIVVRETANGGRIRIRDVATVNDGFVDSNRINRLNGKPSLTIVVKSPTHSKVTDISKAVNKWVKDVNTRLPEGVEVFVQFDFASLYFERIELVSENAVQGFILVLITLLLFLRPTIAFWVASGIVVAFTGAFMLMPATGVSLNMLSLFAMLLVLGIVVDDAIVVGESIHHQIERGKKGVEASILGARVVQKPVIFAVMTTMIAFTPWLFLSGATSNFTKHITITIILALSFSLVESFLILPAHLSHLKKPARIGPLMRFQARIANSMIWFADKLYRPVATLAVRWRYATVTAFTMALLASFTLLAQGYVPFRFQPDIESSFIQFNVVMPEGTPYARNLQIYNDLRAAVSKVKTNLKEEEGKDIILTDYEQATDSGVYAMITIVEANQRSITSNAVGERIRKAIGAIPDAEDIKVQSTFNDSGADISLGLEAKDLDKLLAATQDAESYFKGVGGAYDVRDNLQSATDEIRLDLKPGAERFGLTLAEISRQVRQAYYGQEVQRLPRNGEDVRVMVRYPKKTRESIDSLNSFRVRTADGREVPLSAVANIDYAPSFKRIVRRDREREARIYVELRQGVERGPVMKDFYANFVPEWKQRHPDVNILNRGDAEDQAEFMAELGGLYLIAFFAMYALLAIGFNSYWQPMLIMSAVPFGFMGAMFGFVIYGVDMDIFSTFGLGAAAGVVVNDNLVLIDRVNKLRERGVGAMAALVEAGVTRFRPIILTSVTTFIGLAPILMETSTAAQFLIPTVVALSFGVFFATFVTLLFVPAMYAVGVDIARFYRWAWTGVHQPAFGEGATIDGPAPDVDDIEYSGAPAE